MYENGWRFPSFDTAANIIMLCEKCFLSFNSHLSVTPFFGLTLAYRSSFSEFAGIWMVNIFFLQTRTRSKFYFLSHFSDAHKQQVSAIGVRRSERNWPLRHHWACKEYLINKTQLKLLTHKAAALLQIMVSLDLWYVICSESYLWSKLASFFWPTLYRAAGLCFRP